MRRRTYHLLFLAAAFAGFVYRLRLSALAYQEILFDMKGYADLANILLSGRLVVDCCIKNMGYPIFLAGVSILHSHTVDVSLVRTVQIFADLATACLIYFTGKRLSGVPGGMTAAVLYLANPISASYVGIILPETMTLFYFALLAFLLTRRGWEERSVYWLATGALLGLIIFTRHSFLYFAFISIAVLFVFRFRGWKRLRFVLMCLAGFVTINLYSLVGYYRQFDVISLIPPYNMSMGMAYATFYTGRYPELMSENYPGYDSPEYFNMNRDYYAHIPSDPQGTIAVNAKYRALLIEKLKTDWPQYLRQTGKDILYIWDKYHLFLYTDPYYPGDEQPVRILNASLLFLAVAGMALYALRSRTAQPIFLVSICVFSTITLFFPIISSESRHSIAAYGFVAVWAGYCLERTGAALFGRNRAHGAKSGKIG